MKFNQLDPTQDPRWMQLVERHSKASVFHTVGWLRALRETYQYEPVAFTTSMPGESLRNGLVFCHINSWLTGRRLVSLPFSDHCEPLCDSSEDLRFLIQSLQARMNAEGWKYIEIRPIDSDLGQAGEAMSFVPGAQYFFHTIDLHPTLEEVFGSLKKDSVQRRIQHAERVGLAEKCGNSEKLLKEFYDLFVITRDRHQLPAIPQAWFRNLIHNLGQALEIRVAYKDEVPVAAVLILQFRDVYYYKYGCSDTQFNRLGATPWLLWRAIEAAKSSGAIKFDLGRTEQGNEGLLAFKNHWVPSPKQLVYWDFPKVSGVGTINGWKVKMAKSIFSHIPRKLLAVTGKLIYRHIG
jgi:Acetyltransferase (GNAT) domain